MTSQSESEPGKTESKCFSRWRSTSFRIPKSACGTDDVVFTRDVLRLCQFTAMMRASR
jgi:hypothetical protein